MIRSERALEGELSIDHRASPGLRVGDPDSERAARRAGLPVAQLGEGAVYEVPTYTCSHCQAAVIVNPLRRTERVTCHGCMKRLCGRCELLYRIEGGACRSFAALIDHWSEALALRKP